MYPEHGVGADKQCLDTLIEPDERGRELIGRRDQNGEDSDPQLTRGGLGFRPRRLPGKMKGEMKGK